ncbi:MAG: SH3 domain-containing protein [Spirochaetes bacterium]|nr:SH3 domain-containing protein [Spirochaetota bacterium]
MKPSAKGIAIVSLSFFSIVLLGGLCMVSLAQEADPVLKNLDIQGNSVNVRANADVKTAVVKRMNTGDVAEVIEKGKEETIGGKRDYWYRIKFYDGSASKTGWVFGAFTSLKQEGRKRLTMVFEGCTADSNNFSHKLFRELSGKKWDFSDTGHNFGAYELCIAAVDKDGNPSEAGAKEYVGKRFEVVLNDLLVTPSCMWEPEVCKREMKAYTRPSVIYLRLIK